MQPSRAAFGSQQLVLSSGPGALTFPLSSQLLFLPPSSYQASLPSAAVAPVPVAGMPHHFMHPSSLDLLLFQIQQFHFSLRSIRFPTQESIVLLLCVFYFLLLFIILLPLKLSSPQLLFHL
jgi:hypothetical protein